MPASWPRELKALLPGAALDEPMWRHTTYRIGGPADAYVEALSLEDVRRLYSFARERALPVFLIGWGSNLLVQDGGIRGVVLRLRGAYEELSFQDSVVSAGAGVRLPALAAACAERGLAGAESLVGVPGTMGGALVMNAGTREGEIGSLVRAVTVFDLKTLQERVLAAAEVSFSYRASSLEEQVILGGELVLNHGDKVDILRRIRQFQKKRLQSQPVHTFNVGSTFKNPPGRFVAKLIEEAGLKGLRRGGVKVSQMHANFFENDRQGMAQDVLDLVEAVRAAVRQHHGIELELEMKVVGEA